MQFLKSWSYLFVQNCKWAKPSLAEKSSLQSQLSTYTAKVVNIVLLAIQNELELSEKNLNLREENYIKSQVKDVLLTLRNWISCLKSQWWHHGITIINLYLWNIIQWTFRSKQYFLSSDNSKPTTLSDNVDKGNILQADRIKHLFTKF